MARPEDEISLVASSVPPRTMIDHPPPGTVGAETASNVLPVIPALFPGPPVPPVSLGVPDGVMSQPSEGLPGTVVPDAPSLQLVPGFLQIPHHLDRSLPRDLDYKGFRFKNINHLYLAMMVEQIGCPEKLRAASKHASLKSTVKLVEHCCSKALMWNWTSGKVELWIH